MKNILLVLIVLQSTFANAQYFQRYFNKDVSTSRANYKSEVFYDGLCTRVNFAGGNPANYFNVAVGFTTFAGSPDTSAIAQYDDMRFVRTNKDGKTVSQNYGYSFAKNGSTLWLNAEGHAICEISDGAGGGGYIAVGKVKANSKTGVTLPGGADVLVTRITSAGSAVNRYRFDFQNGSDELNCVIRSQFDPGYFIACGTSTHSDHSKVIVMKFNAMGMVAWANTYHFDPTTASTFNNFCIGKGIAEDPATGNLFVVGSYYNNSAPLNQNVLIFKLSPAGIVAFSKELDLNMGTQEEMRAIKFTNDNNLIMGGFTSGTPGALVWDSWLIKMSTAGAFLFDKVLRHVAGGGVTCVSKGIDVIERINTFNTAEYYLAGLHGDPVTGITTNSICKADLNGNGLEWYSYQPVYPYNDHGMGIDFATTAMTAPGLRLFSNMFGSLTYSDSYMLRAYFNGATCTDYCPGDLVTTILANPAVTALESYKVDVYNKFTLASQRTKYQTQQICSQATVACGSNEKTDGIIEEVLPASSFSLYPNPASGVTDLEIELSDATTISAYLTDVTGRRIKSILDKEQLQSGIYHFNVNCSDLPSGIYLCEIEFGASHQSVKVLVQH